jgi:hypothetical protein
MSLVHRLAEGKYAINQGNRVWCKLGFIQDHTPQRLMAACLAQDLIPELFTIDGVRAVPGKRPGTVTFPVEGFDQVATLLKAIPAPRKRSS